MKKTGVFLLLVLFCTLRAFSSEGKKQVRLILQDTVSHLSDATDIYLDLGSSPAYIGIEDAEKKFDTSTTAPQIYSMTSNGVACYSNGYGAFTQTTVIRLGFRVAGQSVYSFNATLIDNFDPTSILLLEDRTNNTYHDLRQGSYIVSVVGAGQDDNRFFLHVSYPPIVTDVPAGCNNDDGMINIREDSSITWSACQLYDSGMNYLTAFNNIEGVFNFQSLSEGDYNLVFIYGIYSAISKIHIAGNQIIASVKASSVNVSVGETVSFFSHAPNATGYEWDFGDSTRITGVANPQIYYVEPGEYTVTLKCTNSDGCVSYAYIEIFVSASTGVHNLDAPWTKIITEHKNVQLVTNSGGFIPFTVEVYNLAGQLVSNNKITSETYTINLNSQPSGMYILRLNDAEKSFIQKIILD